MSGTRSATIGGTERAAAVKQLGFIGLGVMGGRMCRNLITRSALPVHGFDVAAERVASLTDSGLQPAGSVAEVLAASDMVFMCLPGEPQVRDVCFGAGALIAHARPGQTIVDMTTATVEVDREVAEALAERGVDFADAPVAKGVPSAEAGTLAITVGASDAVFARIEPFLRYMGTEISHCGGVGTGQVLKLMNNMLIFQTVSALAEAMAIATRAGVARKRVFEILSHGSADSFAMRRHGACMTTGEYPDDWFPTRYSLKDLRYALSLAATVGVDAAGAKVVEKRFEEAIERGYGDLYSPVIYRLLEDA